jgi:hypothetical protein
VTARAKPAVILPSQDCDLLTGSAQIAAWFGLSEGQCSARINDGRIVTFKLPGKATVYALKSENDAHWKAAAAAHHARDGDKRSNETPSEVGASRRG